MALFRSRQASESAGPSLAPDIGVFGDAVDPVERPGTVQRRSRMFHEALRMAYRGADVRSPMLDVLRTEASFIKWVSLRGAVLELEVATEDGATSLGAMEAALGAPAPAGLASVLTRYPQIIKLGFAEVLADPTLNRAAGWHLDVIVWSAQALSAVDALLGSPIPHAARLETPGWYTEPVFAKAERFWDGEDWTARCRRLDGPHGQVFTVPF